MRVLVTVIQVKVMSLSASGVVHTLQTAQNSVSPYGKKGCLLDLTLEIFTKSDSTGSIIKYIYIAKRC